MFPVNNKISQANRKFDRFIRQRPKSPIINETQSLDEILNPLVLSALRKNAKFVNVSRIRYNQHTYEIMLKSALTFVPRAKPTTVTGGAWPVRARPKPFIGLPRETLELPEFDTTTHHHVADWSNTNMLATINNGDVYMWHLKDGQKAISISANGDSENATCIRWSPDGTQIAMGLQENGLGIYNFNTKKISQVECCDNCTINTIEWYNEASFLDVKATGVVTGCSNSVVQQYSLSPFKKTGVKITSDSNVDRISYIKLSCRRNKLAVVYSNNTVDIVDMPQMDNSVSLKMPCKIVAIDWHPWQNALLVVAVTKKRSSWLFLYNINTDRVIDMYVNNRIITALSFNPKSAELVLACAPIKRPGQGKEKYVNIMVLKDIYTPVEDLLLLSGPVLYILWGDKGSILAMLTCDEHVFVWDFFEPKLQKTTIQTRSALDLFGSCIR